jgi:putative spermidine/putrescine transport system permease protein
MDIVHRRTRPLTRLAWVTALLPGAFLFALVVVAPMAYMVRYGAIAGPDYWIATIGGLPGGVILGRTLVIAVQVTLICAVLGYFYTAALCAAGPRLRGLLFALVFIPFLTSVLVRTYAWMILLGAGGPLADLSGPLGALGLVPANGSLLYNRFAVLVGMVNMMLPLFVLPLYSVMSKIPPLLPAAARTMGADRVRAFFSVSIPLSAPGAAAGATVVFTLSLGFLITPQLLGGTDDLMIAQYILMRLRTFADLTAASVLALGLVILVIAIIAVFRIFYPIENLVIADAAARGPRRRRLRSDASPRDSAFAEGFGRAVSGVTGGLSRLPWTGITRVIAGLLGAFMAAPLFITIPVSFTGESFLAFPPPSLSLRWYDAVLGDPSWAAALLESLRVALLATGIAAVVGIPVAFFIARAPVAARVRSGVLGLSILPVVIPLIVLATGCFVWFLQIGGVGNVLALAAAHSILGIPFLVVVLVGALRDFDKRLEYAARSLGANRIRTLWSVTLPVLRAAVLTGLLFAFLQSFDELFIAFVIASPTAPTLPIKMWLATTENISPALAVVSNVFIALTLVILGALAAISAMRRRTKGALQ